MKGGSRWLSLFHGEGHMPMPRMRGIRTRPPLSRPARARLDMGAASHLWVLWAFLSGLQMAACSPHTVRPDPKPPLRMPEAFAEQDPAQPGAPAGRRWWRDFQDPTLSRLMAKAFEGSFDMHAAFARLQQAQAAAEVAGAPKVPSLDLSLGGSYQRLNLARFGVGGGGLDAYGLAGSIEAGYELDLWAKISSGVKAAVLDREAAADSVEAMAMSLSAEVADAYYDLVAARARRRLLAEQAALSASLLELVQLRFGQGLATAVEVNQQRQEVVAAESALEQQVATEAVTRNRLATLLGRAPQRFEPPKTGQLPDLPGLPATGVPAQLLTRRPDVRAAQRRVEAADHRVAVAIADRFPSLRLTASVSSEPSRLNDWLLTPLYNLAANLALPLIDGGRRRAEVDRRRALLAEAVADYGNAVLSALLEVENALVQERQQQRQIARVGEQLQIAKLTLEQARTRYGQGTSDFLSVLTALRSQQEIERTLLDARRQVLSYRIQLCRALGGTWATELRPASAGAQAESS